MNDKQDEENRYVHGYKNREDYLTALAEERGIDPEMVFMFADLLGEAEDFDSLICQLEDFAAL